MDQLTGTVTLIAAHRCLRAGSVTGIEATQAFTVQDGLHGGSCETCLIGDVIGPPNGV